MFPLISLQPLRALCPLFILESVESLSTSRKALAKTRYTLPFSCTEAHTLNFRNENIALHFIICV